MNCWGWATWSDRWKHYERDPENLIRKFTKDEINRFNLGGAYNFWGQAKANANGSLKTWAIFWYATIFKNRGLCLNPTQSLVQNIGHDGSGTNCGQSNKLSTKLARTVPHIHIQNIKENQKVLYTIIHYYKLIKTSFLSRCVGRLKRIFK
jgi:hypothetical protein